MVNKIAKYKIFSTLDLRSAYHQVPLRNEDKPYTAFEACGTLYQFTRIPFGVTNGVASFQRIIDAMIASEHLETTYAYIDNLAVCGDTQLDHDKNLQRFLAAAAKYNLTFNQEKSDISTTELKLLGYSIYNGTIKPDPDRLKPLLEIPVPNTAVELRRIVGMFAYYSQWIRKFSEKVRPLTQTKSFPMTQVAQKAFVQRKEEIAAAAVVAIDDKVPFAVETDASDYGIAVA